MLSARPLILLFGVMALSSSAIAQVLDPDYHVKILGNSYHKIAIDAQDNLVVFGSFHDFEGENFGRLLKIAPDGTRLPLEQLYADGDIAQLKVLPDGKYLIAGRFSKINGNPVRQLLRLNADGTIDNTFSSALEKVEDFRVQDDGKIVALYNRRFHRLLPNGNVDPTFNSTVDIISIPQFCLGNNGEIYFSVLRKINKLTSSGSIDPLFKTSTVQTDVTGLHAQSDGKVLITGNFTQHNNHASRAIMRMHEDGEVDLTFQAQGANNPISIVHERPNGHLIVGGNFNMYNNTVSNLVELNADGSFLRSIGYLTINNVSSIVESSDGKISIAGEFHSVMNQHRYGIARFNADYTLDASFAPVISFNNQNIRTLQVQTDGSLYVGGHLGPMGVFNGNDAIITRIANIHPDGSVNTAFAPFFTTATNYGGVYDHFVLPDNKVIVSGSFGNGWQVIRLNDDGSKDLMFADGAPEIPPGKIIRHGDDLLLCGNFKNYNGAPTPGLVAITTDGGIVRTYDALPVNSAVYQIDFQQDGKMILLGEFPFTSGLKNIIRLTTDGEVDETFNSIRINGNYSDLAVDSLNSIYVVGLVLNSGTTTMSNISKYTPDGIVDATFHPWKGISGFAHILSIEILPDHKIAIGGVFEEIFGFKTHGLAILDKNGKYVFTPTPMFGKGSVVTDMVFINDQLYLSGILRSSDDRETYGIQKIALSGITIPQAPTALAVEVINGKAILSWTDNAANEVAFVVERSATATGEFLPVDTIGYNSSQAEIPLTFNSTNKFRLRAFNYAGSSPHSNTASADWYPIPSGQIALTNSTPSDSKTTLTWTFSLQHHDSFVIQRKLSTEATFRSLDTVSNTVSSFDNLIQPNVVYHYRIGALNTNGILFSNQLSVEWKVLPSGELTVSVTMETAGTVRVEWEGAIKYHDGFIIRRSLQGAAFATLDTVSSAVSSFTDELEAEHEAIYQIVPYNKAGTVHFESESFQWIITSVEELKEEKIHVYPIPTQRYLTLNFPVNKIPKGYTMTTSDGRSFEVPHQLSATQVIFDLEGLTKGVYILRCQFENSVHFERVIKY